MLRVNHLLGFGSRRSVAAGGSGMPTYVGAGPFNGSTGNGTVEVPAGVQEHDLLVIFCETQNEAVSTPAGWSVATDAPVIQASGNVTRLYVFWKRAGASESSVTITDPGDHIIFQ